MPQYLIVKPSGAQVPPDGQKASGDIYLDTQANEQAAVSAAALKFGIGPGVFLWVVDTATLHRYVSSTTVAIG